MVLRSRVHGRREAVVRDRAVNDALPLEGATEREVGVVVRRIERDDTFECLLGAAQLSRREVGAA